MESVLIDIFINLIPLVGVCILVLAYIYLLLKHNQTLLSF